MKQNYITSIVFSLQRNDGYHVPNTNEDTVAARLNLAIP